MNKFLLSFIFCQSSLLSFAQNGDKVIDFYVDTETGSLMSNEHGVDVTHVDGSVANYTITIESLIFSDDDCQCIMSITANGSHDWDEFFIYRLRSINASSANDIVDVEEHALKDPEWNAYEVHDTHIWFKDTFPKSWIEGYDLCYEVHDTRNDHLLTVVIHNAFRHSVVTSITDVYNDSQTIYYDLQGHSSSKPFNGVNIVKNGNKTYKEIH